MHCCRMRKFGVPCPSVVTLRKHILVMSLIGKDSPAPKLRYANLTVADQQDAYEQTVEVGDARCIQCCFWWWWSRWWWECDGDDDDDDYETMMVVVVVVLLIVMMIGLVIMKMLLPVIAALSVYSTTREGQWWGNKNASSARSVTLLSCKWGLGHFDCLIGRVVWHPPNEQQTWVRNPLLQ